MAIWPSGSLRLRGWSRLHLRDGEDVLAAVLPVLCVSRGDQPLQGVVRLSTSRLTSLSHDESFDLAVLRRSLVFQERRDEVGDRRSTLLLGSLRLLRLGGHVVSLDFEMPCGYLKTSTPIPKLTTAQRLDPQAVSMSRRRSS